MAKSQGLPTKVPIGACVRIRGSPSASEGVIVGGAINPLNGVISYKVKWDNGFTHHISAGGVGGVMLCGGRKGRR